MNKRVLIISASALFAFVSISIFFLRLFSLQNPPSQSNPPPPPPTPTQTPSGKIFLEKEIDKKSFLVLASSAGEPITGFDILILYNPTEISITKIEAIKEEYQVIPTIDNKIGKAKATGIKKLNIDALIILEETPLVRFFYEKKQQKPSLIRISLVKDSKIDSNLINNKSEDILSQVEEITL